MNPLADNPSLFGALHDAKTLVGSALRAPDHQRSGWIAARGAEGFGEFERQVSGLRVNGSDDVGSHNLIDDATAFVAKWMHRRHPDRDTAQRPFLLAVNDAARMWAANLLLHAESLAEQKRSRLNLVQSDKSGGALTVSHVSMGGDSTAPQLHLYSVEVRERTAASVDTAVALHAQCDLLVEIIGPMTPESLQLVLARVRKTLESPQLRLKGVLFVLSATAGNLREPLEAFGQEMGERVMAAQLNLSDTAVVWRESLQALEQTLARDGVEPSSAAELCSNVDDGDSAESNDAPHESGSLHDLLRAFAQTEGTQWVALIGRDPQVHLVESSDPNTPAPFDAALSMAVLMSGEAAAAGQQIKVETDTSVTIARVLREPQLGLAVRFLRSEVPEPVANLLIERMCTELESLEERLQ
jgi:hypothetical protein